MTVWLCILNRSNFEVVKNSRVWGVSERHKNQSTKSKIGEKCIFYLIAEYYLGENKKPSIGGIFEIDSDSYIDNSQLFVSDPNSNERFPFRVKVKTVKVYHPELPFKPLVPLLKFITNKSNYGRHLFGRAMRQIPDEDLNLILEMGSKFESPICIKI